MRRRSEKKGSEVEELLRAAEDEMLLKFSVNSHTTHSNHLDLELVRRFDALKSPSSIKKESSSSSSNSVLQPKIKQEGEKKDELDRFEALKGVRKGASSSSSSTGISERSTTNGFESENEEEDEVAKVIQWAMDAARLDPSKTTDDEDEDEDFDDDDDDDDDDEDDRKRKPKK